VPREAESERSKPCPRTLRGCPCVTPADVMILIEATINQVLRGELSPHVANSVAILTGLHLKAAALQIEAERVGALENFPRR
jgi:hypothetical protein